MSLLAVNTVDRLDRPSAYYVGKVSCHFATGQQYARTDCTNNRNQNKRRRYNDRDDEREREREEDPMAKLHNATTLYVGNLYEC